MELFLKGAIKIVPFILGGPLGLVLTILYPWLYYFLFLVFFKNSKWSSIDTFETNHIQLVYFCKGVYHIKTSSNLDIQQLSIFYMFIFFKIELMQ